MKFARHSHNVIRSIVMLAALCAAGGNVNADPAEDVVQAEASLQAGDLPTAMSLLRRAADLNHPLAQARLGDLLVKAEFYPQALELHRKSAEQGEAAGEFGLGRAYADGLGVPRDPALAIEWYRKAEKKEHWPALDALARAYRIGDLGLPKDIAQANALNARVRTLQAAAKKGASK
jgi:uncharacterized protein